MKKEDGKISIIAIVCVCLVLAIIVCVGAYFISTKDENGANKNSTETASHVEKNETQKEEKEKDDSKKKNTKKKSDYKDIDLWNGTYKNENGIEISIYRSTEDMLTVDFNKYGDEMITSNGFDVEYDSKNPNTIDYSESMFDDEYSVKIVKDGDKLEVISTSDNDEDILKNASGTYNKNEFENNGWDGMYVNDEYAIILAQYDKDKIYATFRTEISFIGKILEDFDNKNISYHEDFLDDTNDIEITKTDKGISVVSSSSDKDSILNKISDMEFEKNN